MDIREAYYLGGAERAMAGDVKVWPLYDDYCYTSPTGSTYGSNYCDMPDIETSPNAVYRIMFRPNASTAGGVLFGGRSTYDSWDFRLLWTTNRRAVLDIGNSRITAPSAKAMSASTDYYLEIGNYYVKDLSDGSIVVSGATKADANVPVLPMRISLGYGRVYQAEIWENNVLKHLFLPVRWFDQKYGVYDTIGHRFYPVGNQTVSGHTCGSGEPNWSGDTPSPDQHWYLVPVTDSENNPPAGDDYVFYSPLRSAVLEAVVGNTAEDSSLRVTYDLPVTATTGGEYLITDETYSGLTKWNLIGGIGGAFRLKGKTGDWYLRTERTTIPDTAREKGVRLGSAEPTYFNLENGQVYVNFVSQNWCWAFAWEIAFPGTEWEFPTPGAYKCNGYYASYDFASHFYLYRLVRK